VRKQLGDLTKKGGKGAADNGRNLKERKGGKSPTAHATDMKTRRRRCKTTWPTTKKPKNGGGKGELVTGSEKTQDCKFH